MAVQAAGFVVACGMRGQCYRSMLPVPLNSVNTMQSLQLLYDTCDGVLKLCEG